MIHHQNYEAWFLDFLEGNLSEKQVRILMSFLAKNPTLKQELEEMELLILPTDDSFSLPNKDRLKKITHADINLINSDKLLIGELENDLSLKQQIILNQQLAKKPKLVKDQKAYQLTRLSPDLLVKYPDKTSLKRHDKKIIPIRVLTSIAAALVLLIMVVFALNQKDNVANPPMVQLPQTTPKNKPLESSNNLKSLPKSKDVFVIQQKKKETTYPGFKTTQRPKANKQNPVFTSEEPDDIVELNQKEPLPQSNTAEKIVVQDQPKRSDTLAIQKPILAPEFPAPKPVLVHSVIPKKSQQNPTSKNRVINLSQPKELALAAIDKGVKRITNQTDKQERMTFQEGLTSTIGALTNNHVKIEKTVTQKRKLFHLSIGSFAVARSQSL